VRKERKSPVEARKGTLLERGSLRGVGEQRPEADKMNKQTPGSGGARFY